MAGPPPTLSPIGDDTVSALLALRGREVGGETFLIFEDEQGRNVERTYADISAIAADLGYAPTTSIEVGVPRFVDWYRGYHSG